MDRGSSNSSSNRLPPSPDFDPSEETRPEMEEIDVLPEDAAAQADSPPPAGRKNGKMSFLLSALLLSALVLSAVAGLHLRTHRAVEFYIEMLKSADPAARNYARDSLSRLGPACIYALLPLAEGPNKEEVLTAIDTLALISASEATGILVKLTTHQDAEIRIRALEALGESALPHVFTSIEAQISSPDYGTRLCAIAALENFDPHRSVPILLDLLDDRDWRVRNSAAKTLISITAQNMGVPTSTSSPAANAIICQRWREWWAQNGPTFKKTAPPSPR